VRLLKGGLVLVKEEGFCCIVSAFQSCSELSVERKLELCREQVFVFVCVCVFVCLCLLNRSDIKRDGLHGRKLVLIAKVLRLRVKNDL
jgi:hypothetical protein